MWRETVGRLILATKDVFQSTPSVWRETYKRGKGAKNYVISIHSLRVEGDRTSSSPHRRRDPFQSTPSVWRETRRQQKRRRDKTFQSTPSVWRETVLPELLSLWAEFQSTPSVWRETVCTKKAHDHFQHFNPLPPCGGRRYRGMIDDFRVLFQSTPSVWRETKNPALVIIDDLFQSTPSVWRET